MTSKFAFVCCLVLVLGRIAAAETHSLTGQWAFRLDPENVGLKQNWSKERLPGKIQLPGSVDEAKVAPPNTQPPTLNGLYRTHPYIGAAWYQREIEIPQAWASKRVSLLLERCRWDVHVWLDERDYGTHDTLCTPQVVEFGEGLKAGKHRLTIRVDNTAKFDLGTHISSWSEHTQTNWNGMIGRLELRASDPIAIESMQIYPDVAHKMASVRLNLSNFSGRPATATIELSVTEKERLAGIPLMLLDYEIPVGGKWLEADVPMGERIKPWDEFSPALYTMMAKLEARVENRSYADQRSEQFGMRQLGIDDGRQFTMNGRRIFLRGTVECCVFPQTGYPSMDLKNWAWIFSICRSHGLNHMRFHSWCPPEAAFAAADEAGMMLQVEGPQANVLQGKDPSYDRFIAEEIHGILAAYGNHPSFCFLAMGNEVAGSVESLEKLLDYCIKTDPRHLYASHSNDWTIAPVTNRQYLVTPRIRGVKGEDTDHDFRSQVGKHPCPQVSHEVGQWAVFPRMAEIGKYTGVRRARNFELIREQLRANGILDQAEDFTQASGHLSALLYKEEVESLLRTPGHAGFQLLQLNDYPGQGTALVGMLDPFWDSKGFITPEQFHCFCGPTVPLARLKKRVFTSDETLSAKVEVAHFGPATLENAQPAWSLKDDQGRAIASGRWTPRTIPTGALSPLGAIDVDLSKVSAPARLKLSVTLEGTSAANDWQIWVYPALPVPSAPADIYVSRAWDGTTTAALAAGRKVLLLPPQTAFAPGKSLAGKFLPVFWSPVFFNLFKKGPMGMLCDPKHPALAAFPTDGYADWQWRDLLDHSVSVNLEGTGNLRPIVQVIEDFSNNRKLSNLFEAQVGNGRLLVCTIDVCEKLDHRPATRQLRRSLYAYMASEHFRPTQRLEPGVISKLFQKK